MVLTVRTLSGEIIGRFEFDEREKKTAAELLRERQIYSDAPCNGRKICGKCLVQYQEGAPDILPFERDKIAEEQLQEGMRLACCSVPQKDAVIVLQRAEEIEVCTQFEDSTEPQKQLAPPIKQDNHRKEVQQSGKAAGTLEKGAAGIAVDIGTTTLAAALVDLTTGEIICYAASVNHQRAYGADVIARIKASCEGKAGELKASIQKDLQVLFCELLEKGQRNNRDIKQIVMTGNTTMCHLLFGYSCAGLGSAPFQPVNLSLQHCSYRELFCEETYPAEITVLPGISAFVGADIVAGLYGSGMCGGAPEMEREGKNSLFLDIGTNAEMALLTPKGLFVTSAAAGPAFEGGKISHGMPGILGAVTKAALFGRERMVTTTIGNISPIGICGSGIIEVVSELKRHRIIDENGTLLPAYQEKGFPVAKEIFFTQEDIREVQMAKAAIRAGIEVLLEEAEISADSLADVLVAGGFGAALNIEKAAAIGLFPSQLADKIKLVGNSALQGTIMVLREPQKISVLQSIANEAAEKNLALQEQFQEKYIAYLQF